MFFKFSFVILLVTTNFILVETRCQEIPKSDSYSYYHGKNRSFTNIFAKIKRDTAILDLIFIQKYPRELLTDTLLYSELQGVWLGRTSKLHKRDGQFYVQITKFAPSFSSKEAIVLKPNEEYYAKQINEYKNIAVLHQVYASYLNQSADRRAAVEHYHRIKKHHNLDQSLDHREFIKQLEKFKEQLEQSEH